MTSILDLDELAQSTLQLVGKALQTSSGVLLLLDVNGNYYPHSSFGLDSSAATAARIDKTSLSSAGWPNKKNRLFCAKKWIPGPSFGDCAEGEAGPPVIKR